MPIFLLTGTAYSEPQVSKPYKVCPEVVTAKDTPCRVSTPTAVIANRIEISLDNKEKEIKRLQEENALLRKLLQELKN